MLFCWGNQSRCMLRASCIRVKPIVDNMATGHCGFTDPCRQPVYRCSLYLEGHSLDSKDASNIFIMSACHGVHCLVFYVPFSTFEVACSATDVQLNQTMTPFWSYIHTTHCAVILIHWLKSIPRPTLSCLDCNFPCSVSPDRQCGVASQRFVLLQRHPKVHSEKYCIEF